MADLKLWGRAMKGFQTTAAAADSLFLPLLLRHHNTGAIKTIIICAALPSIWDVLNAT